MMPQQAPLPCDAVLSRGRPRHNTCNWPLITDERHISGTEFRLKGELLTPCQRRDSRQRHLDWEQVASGNIVLRIIRIRIICGRCGLDFSGPTRFPPGFAPGILGSGQRVNIRGSPEGHGRKSETKERVSEKSLKYIR